MLFMMAAEIFKILFVGLDHASPDQIRQIDIFISFIWRAKRAKKKLKRIFFFLKILKISQKVAYYHRRHIEHTFF